MPIDTKLLTLRQQLDNTTLPGSAEWWQNPLFERDVATKLDFRTIGRGPMLKPIQPLTPHNSGLPSVQPNEEPAEEIRRFDNTKYPADGLLPAFWGEETPFRGAPQFRHGSGKGDKTNFLRRLLQGAAGRGDRLTPTPAVFGAEGPRGETGPAGSAGANNEIAQIIAANAPSLNPATPYSNPVDRSLDSAQQFSEPPVVGSTAGNVPVPTPPTERERNGAPHEHPSIRAARERASLKRQAQGYDIHDLPGHVGPADGNVSNINFNHDIGGWLFDADGSQVPLNVLNARGLVEPDGTVKKPTAEASGVDPVSEEQRATNKQQYNMDLYRRSLVQPSIFDMTERTHLRPGYPAESEFSKNALADANGGYLRNLAVSSMELPGATHVPQVEPFTRPVLRGHPDHMGSAANLASHVWPQGPQQWTPPPEFYRRAREDGAAFNAAREANDLARAGSAQPQIDPVAQMPTVQPPAAQPTAALPTPPLDLDPVRARGATSPMEGPMSEAQLAMQMAQGMHDQRIPMPGLEQGYADLAKLEQSNAALRQIADGARAGQDEFNRRIPEFRAQRRADDADYWRKQDLYMAGKGPRPEHFPNAEDEAIEAAMVEKMQQRRVERDRLTYPGLAPARGAGNNEKEAYVPRVGSPLDEAGGTRVAPTAEEMRLARMEMKADNDDRALRVKEADADEQTAYKALMAADKANIQQRYSDNKSTKATRMNRRRKQNNLQYGYQGPSDEYKLAMMGGRSAITALLARGADDAKLGVLAQDLAEKRAERISRDQKDANRHEEVMQAGRDAQATSERIAAANNASRAAIAGAQNAAAGALFDKKQGPQPSASDVSLAQSQADFTNMDALYNSYPPSQKFEFVRELAQKHGKTRAEIQAFLTKRKPGTYLNPDGGATLLNPLGTTGLQGFTSGSFLPNDAILQNYPTPSWYPAFLDSLK